MLGIAIATIVALGVSLPILLSAGIASKFALAVVTGLGLASGFYIKDIVIDKATQIKEEMTMNLEQGKPIWFSAHAKVAKDWRRNNLTIKKIFGKGNTTNGNAHQTNTSNDDHQQDEKHEGSFIGSNDPRQAAGQAV